MGLQGKGLVRKRCERIQVLEFKTQGLVCRIIPKNHEKQ